MSNIPFQTIDWTSIQKVEHKGETGTSYWQTLEFNGLRIRIVEYTKDTLLIIGAKKDTSSIAWKANS